MRKSGFKAIRQWYRADFYLTLTALSSLLLHRCVRGGLRRLCEGNPLLEAPAPDLVMEGSSDHKRSPLAVQYFKELVRDIVPALADSGLADVGAGLSEAAAVCRARLLLDHRFARLGREDLDRTYLLGVENDLGEDPYDCLVSPVKILVSRGFQAPRRVLRWIKGRWYDARMAPAGSHRYGNLAQAFLSFRCVGFAALRHLTASAVPQLKQTIEAPFCA